MKEPIVILSYGAITAVGNSAAQTCAAIRASITGFGEASFFTDALSPEPFIVAQVRTPLPPPKEKHFDRLVKMAVHALRECLDEKSIDPSRTALLLGVRESFRVGSELDGKHADLLRQIENELQLRFHADSRVLPDGNAAAFRGFLEARELLVAKKVKNCIVGGVDSYINWNDLKRFEATYRLKTERVAQGFIPGEGAAFVSVTTKTLAAKRAVKGEIHGIGLADEDQGVTVLSDGHPTGKGLHRALQVALDDAQLSESRIAFRISDLNGEYYRGIDSMLAINRFYRTRREHLVSWLPAASAGEIGAAAGALLVIVACIGIAKCYAPGAIAMCEASSDAGLRAGCLVTGPDSPLSQQGS
jgi:3-oxoacyl-[acyl-carrier-protein] synthase-1